MEITGRIIVDIPLQEGVSKAGNPWKKKEWVMETVNTAYPRKVKFHLFGDRADNIHMEIGKVYTLTFEIESREFNGRWYTDIAGLSAVEVQETVGISTAPQDFSSMGLTTANNFTQPGNTPDFTNSSSEEDLPF